jgi:hypothetical protein
LIAATLGPVPPRVRHQVEGPALVRADDSFGFAVLGYDLAVGDRVEVLDTGLPGCVVRVTGGLQGLQALKGDAFLAEQDAQAPLG